MQKYVKKITIFTTLLFLFSFRLISTPLENVNEYILENGLQVFLLEDSSDALIHANFVCKAGFSQQTQNTNGFFKLYTRLVRAISPNINYSSIQCNADSSIYSLNFTPSQTNSVLQNLSSAVFNCDFSDEILQTELTKLKKEVQENADTMSTYINAAIDSRVFSDTPWKHDSGIYPPIFKKTTEKNARTQITNIATHYYIPKNCALFIYGNFNSEKLLVSLKNTFGRYYSNFIPPTQNLSNPKNKQRKYVFHNDEISNELTQVVVQYTMLSFEQADLIAATYNYENSSFKQNILSNNVLNIPGDEYIDISAAHKKDTNRLIIQTLMQNPEFSTNNSDKKKKITPLEQTNIFLNAVKSFPITQEEFFYGKTRLTHETDNYSSTPSLLMEKLTNFWPLEEYYKTSEDDFESLPNSTQLSPSPLTNVFVSRKNYIFEQDLQQTTLSLNAEEPFVFVIINSKVYKDNKKAFLNAGYEEINANNSSWYVLEMNKNIKEQFKPEEMLPFQIKSSGEDNYYYEKNLESIKTTKLKNGMKVFSKKNENSTDISLVLSISGGKLHSSNNNGFEEVMVNLLTVLIQKEIYKKQMQGIIIGNTSITYKTDISTSSIIIHFEKEDTAEVCSAISNALVYGEVAPADADRAVSSRQFRKRLENGSANSQMISGTIKAIYGKSELSNIFDTEKDILLDTNYNSILEAYPKLLNANRFSVIVCGAFEDNIFEYLENSFSTLASTDTSFSETELSFSGLTRESLSFPKSPLTVKIRHTFLTDIPAEKAGPQPAVLVPTKEFLDPVFFINESPKKGTKESALFSAVINYLGKEIQKSVDLNKKFENSSVTITLPQSYINLGIVSISNVSNTKEADVVYRDEIQNLNSRLKENQAMQNVVQEIKDSWSLLQMSESSTNSGTALLIQKGLELSPETFDALFYLNEYNYIQNATVQDFIEIMKYFPQRAKLRVYSADSK